MWISSILNSALTAVLVNGCAGPWIQCKRGLRQGDPLSPYLFLLVAETLQRLIRQDAAIRHPTETNRPCAVLQYADDTLIVLRGDLAGATAVRQTLDTFAALRHCLGFRSTMTRVLLYQSIWMKLLFLYVCRRSAAKENPSHSHT